MVALRVISVAVDASSSYFQSYMGGVMSLSTGATACGTSTDHANNIVGYGI